MNDRHHFIHVTTKTDVVPSGGDPWSWLNYYKLNAENEEIFLPFTQDALRGRPGDILWIMYERALIAWAPILRVVEDAMNDGRPEVWYDARDLHWFVARVPLGEDCGFDLRTGSLDSDIGEVWLAPFR